MSSRSTKQGAVPLNPQIIADIEAKFSEAKAYEALSASGGNSISVPKCAAGSTIGKMIGTDLAAWLCERYGGEVIDVPGKTSFVAAARRAHVAKNPNKSANVLAKDLGVTSRTIRKIRGAQKEKPDR